MKSWAKMTSGGTFGSGFEYLQQASGFVTEPGTGGSIEIVNPFSWNLTVFKFSVVIAKNAAFPHYAKLQDPENHENHLETQGFEAMRAIARSLRNA